MSYFPISVSSLNELVVLFKGKGNNVILYLESGAFVPVPAQQEVEPNAVERTLVEIMIALVSCYGKKFLNERFTSFFSRKFLMRASELSTVLKFAEEHYEQVNPSLSFDEAKQLVLNKLNPATKKIKRK
jgi:hypothetical protein